MSKTTSRVVASDGGTGHLDAPTIVKYGIAQGVIAAKDEAAWHVYAQQHPGDALSAVCARMNAAGPVTPATPATARSRASVAAGSGGAAPTYPSAWSRAVSAAQRVTGSRKAQPAKSAWPTVTPSAHIAGTTAQTTRSADGFYDKSVQPSAFAAQQEQARQADHARMAAEQKARFSA